YPSVPKKGVDLGKGVVILPPERIVSPKKPEQPKEEKAQKQQEKEVKQIKKEIQPISVQSNLLVIGVGILAVIAIIMSFIAMSSVASIKSQLKLISADLKEFSQSQVELTTEMYQPHSINASVPLNQALSPFSIPIPNQEIEGKGTIQVVIPAYNYPVSIPWEGKITVFGSVTANTTAIPSNQQLNVNYTLPSTGAIRMKVSVSDLFKGKLNSVIERLDELSK
ncbi:MAG: hypothetical protein ACPLYF_00620, partial [Fervidobacterium sp.]